ASPSGASGSASTSMRAAWIAQSVPAWHAARARYGGFSSCSTAAASGSSEVSGPSSTRIVPSGSATQRTAFSSMSGASAVTVASAARGRCSPETPGSRHGGTGGADGRSTRPPSRASRSWSGSPRRKSPTLGAGLRDVLVDVPLAELLVALVVDLAQQLLGQLVDRRLHVARRLACTQRVAL